MSSNLSEILKLSIPERILMVEAIWDSITEESNKPGAYNLSDEQIKILEEELHEYGKNPQEGSTWDEVKKRILSRK